MVTDAVILSLMAKIDFSRNVHVRKSQANGYRPIWDMQGHCVWVDGELTQYEQLFILRLAELNLCHFED